MKKTFKIVVCYDMSGLSNRKNCIEESQSFSYHPSEHEIKHFAEIVYIGNTMRRTFPSQKEDSIYIPIIKEVFVKEVYSNFDFSHISL